ncbi:transposase [Thiolapillus sp.]|uniref:transposase n=1 Tax=Thiolapillus sp. TaxID=2017437 RepID=UPI0035A8B2A7
MSCFEKLTHVLWHCQYHIVWVPKYRYRVLTGDVAREVHNRYQAWRAKRGLVVPSSREAALLTRRAHSARGEAK